MPLTTKSYELSNGFALMSENEIMEINGGSGMFPSIKGYVPHGYTTEKTKQGVRIHGSNLTIIDHNVEIDISVSGSGSCSSNSNSWDFRSNTGKIMSGTISTPWGKCTGSLDSVSVSVKIRL